MDDGKPITVIAHPEPRGWRRWWYRIRVWQRPALAEESIEELEITTYGSAWYFETEADMYEHITGRRSEVLDARDHPDG